MKYAIYIKGNSDDEIQQKAESLIKRARSHGLELFDVYDDKNGVDGNNCNQLKYLLIDAEKRRFDILIITNLEDLGDSFSHLFKILDELGMLGIDIISLSERINTSNPNEKYFFKMVSIFSGIMHNMNGQKTVNGLRRAKLSGQKLGRRLKAVDNNRIVQLRDQGWSWRRIGTELGISHLTARSRVLRNMSSDAPKEKPAEIGG